MAGIVGEGISDYVAKQINDRQKYIGKVNRDANTLTYFHSRTAWAKLASSSLVESNPGLARSYMLFNGRNMASGIKPEGAYDTSDKDFGIVPMPGILSLDIKALNRGSIKEAHIKFKVNSRKQFEAIDKVYLRLGFNMLLEWGWSNYVVDDTTFNMGSTLADSEWWTKNNVDYVYWLGRINYFRKNYHGNYDGFFGRVTNYNWKFNPDGSYDVDLKLISHGDVVESLRTVPPGGKLAGSNKVEVDSYYSSTPVSSVLIQGGLKATSGAVKIFTPEEIETNENLSPNGKYLLDTSLIKDKLSEHLFSLQFYGWAFNNYRIYTPANGDGDSTTYFTLNPDNACDKKTAIYLTIDGTQYGPIGVSFLENPTVGGKKDAFFLYYKPSKPVSTDTEIPDVDPTEVPTYVRFQYLLWYLNEYCLPINKTTKNPPFVIDWRGVGSVGGDKPIPMYMPQQQNLTLSYNPSKYIIRNAEHNFTTLEVSSTTPTTDAYQNLTGAINNSISGMSFIDARNIYCNVANLLEKIPISSNDQNETKIDIFGFLKDICNEINTALGSINNLEPIMDEDTNTLIIVDSTNFPKKKELLNLLNLPTPRVDYLLQMFGYRNFKGLVASFVRNINLETKLSKETATLITIGATAEGSSPGTDATAFSKMNAGTKDRFTTEFVSPGNERNDPTSPIYDQLAEAVNTNYLSLYGYNEIADWLPFTQLAGVNIVALQFLDQESQEKNMQLVKDYFAYHESKLHKNTKAGGPGIGFLPLELSLDIDGLSGIKIYNGIQIDTSFLPQNYPKSLEFVLAGVDHTIQNNDWVTKLRVIACPRTEGVELPESKPPGNFSGGNRSGNPTALSPNRTPMAYTDCASFFNSVPLSNGLLPKDRNDLKNRKQSLPEYQNLPKGVKDQVEFVINKNEGGYFHPLNYVTFKNDTTATINPGLGASGETLWGEDRFTGYKGNRNQYPKKAKFWDIIDKYSGFGDLAKYSNKNGKKSEFWVKGDSNIPLKKLKQYKTSGWNHKVLGDFPNYNPSIFKGRSVAKVDFDRDMTTAKNLAVEIVADSINDILNNNFTKKGAQYKPLRDLIENNPSFLYLWIRARYNGPGYAQEYANNLRKVWDTGERDVKKLICKDLQYRWNYNLGKTYEPDIKKTIDYFRYWYV